MDLRICVRLRTKSWLDLSYLVQLLVESFQNALVGFDNL